MGLRVLNIGLGLWVFVSAFLWPHSRAEQYNAWVVGIVVVTAGLAAVEGSVWARSINAACGAWLAASALFLSRAGSVTAWNNLAAGLCIAAVALSPTLPVRRHPRLPRAV
jgi:hypothetical protein